MRIGIITLYHNYNYGAVLQAYALQSIIKSMQVSCETVNYYREINGVAKKPRPKFVDDVINIFRSMTYNKAIDLPIYIKYQNKIDNRNRLFDSFIKNNISESKEVYYGHEKLQELNNYYDVFIAGSDNIWNKNLLDSAFFLDFVDDNKGKMSYAAGMSYDSADENIISFISPLLNRLDYISTREPTGKSLIEKVLGKDVFLAIDPTILLSADEWKLVERSIDLECDKGYILCFFIEPSDTMIQTVIQIKKETGKRVICLPFLHQRINPHELEYADLRLFNVGPEELLFLIRNADFVCTDSFHGTVFSVIFNRQFACFRRFQDEKRSTLNFRIDHLLNRLDIPNRIIESTDDYNIIQSSIIDYDIVNQNIGRIRTESIQFLYNCIKSFMDKD